MLSLHVEPPQVSRSCIGSSKLINKRDKNCNIVASRSNLIRLFSSELLKTGIHLISTSLRHAWRSSCEKERSYNYGPGKTLSFICVIVCACVQLAIHTRVCSVWFYLRAQPFAGTRVDLALSLYLPVQCDAIGLKLCWLWPITTDYASRLIH